MDAPKLVKVILGSEALLAPLTGIGNYNLALAREFVANPEIEVLGYAYGKFLDLPNIVTVTKQNSHEESSSGAESLFNRFKKVAAKSPAIVTAYEMLLPKWDKINLRHHRDAIFHSTNFLAPSFNGVKCVTIHDLSTYYYPDYHPASRVGLVNNAIENVINEKIPIVTDSDFIRAQLIADFSVDPKIVHAIHLGADPSFRQRDAEECNITLNKFGIEYNAFFLSVSTIEPRKNILGLMRGYLEYLETTKKTVPLVLAGDPGWNSEEEHELIEKLQKLGQLKYLGYVSDFDLRVLFSAAKSFVFPSHYEGFGLPVLEAMQSGIPVVTSKNSAMSEILAGSGIEIDANDANALAMALSRLTEDDAYQKSLASKSLLRATMFSWSKTAQKHVDLYKSIF